MDVVFQINHLKNTASSTDKKHFVATALFNVTPIKKRICQSHDFINTFREFVYLVRKSISYREIKAIHFLNPVIQISIDYMDITQKEEKHYSLEAPLLAQYLLTDKQLTELGEDLFLILVEKWLESHTAKERIDQ